MTLNLPFVSISVNPRDRERQIAREVVIRLKDRRVLSSCECCDGCIDNALASLQKVRTTLVDKQVELSSDDDGPLFLLLEAMAQGIRQFLTYEERLRSSEHLPLPEVSREFYRPLDVRQEYFDALELLRGHLSRCLRQVAAIAGMELPKDGLILHYQGEWQTDAYLPLF
ncbi:hypothetical protein [Mesorhizobium sp. LNHC229A00]|uniref:hypothetical protein n=1 Tax=Mesorhizobium sp. LNHC229A00 TaxID=1287240 RepID=UPI0012EC6B40|nr:hypothetical protein [Mesorhizobium sp. LNHC229A00]